MITEEWKRKIDELMEKATYEEQLTCLSKQADDLYESCFETEVIEDANNALEATKYVLSRISKEHPKQGYAVNIANIDYYQRQIDRLIRATEEETPDFGNCEDCGKKLTEMPEGAWGVGYVCRSCAYRAVNEL